MSGRHAPVNDSDTLDQAVAPTAAFRPAISATRWKSVVTKNWPTTRFSRSSSPDNKHAYTQPCGCTGLGKTKRRVARAHVRFAKKLKDEGWDAAARHAGNLDPFAHGSQAEIKFHRSLEALRQMGYRRRRFRPR